MKTKILENIANNLEQQSNLEQQLADIAERSSPITKHRHLIQATLLIKVSRAINEELHLETLKELKQLERTEIVFIKDLGMSEGKSLHKENLTQQAENINEKSSTETN